MLIYTERKWIHFKTFATNRSITLITYQHIFIILIFLWASKQQKLERHWKTTKTEAHSNKEHFCSFPLIILIFFLFLMFATAKNRASSCLIYKKSFCTRESGANNIKWPWYRLWAFGWSWLGFIIQYLLWKYFFAVTE